MESAHGSFLFQPLYYGESNTVEDYLDFWHTIPIPDRVLSNILAAHKTQREAAIRAELHAWAERYENDPAVLQRERAVKRSRNGILVERESKRDAESERLEKRYWKMGSGTVRAIAVAMQMRRCSTTFSEPEQARIREHRIPFPQHLSFTVEEIWHGFQLEEIAEAALTDGDLVLQYELAELRHRFYEQGA